ncbi:MAG TPA: RNA 2',3'-cyclic phosphodiesterase [Streptosporangiaceae bacterium]
MRLFVAIVPPPAVVAQLARWLAPLQAAGPGLRWTGPDSWHITLAFLGEVAEPVLPELSIRLERAARRHPVQDLALRGGGAFPAARRARAVLAVVAGEPGAPGAMGPARSGPLHALAASVAAGARRAGAPPPDEGRRYRPHLTLALPRPPADARAVVASLAELDIGPWRAADIRLIRSHLGGPAPGPPRYAEVGRWPLREPTG